MVLHRVYRSGMSSDHKEKAERCCHGPWMVYSDTVQTVLVTPVIPKLPSCRKLDPIPVLGETLPALPWVLLFSAGFTALFLHSGIRSPGQMWVLEVPEELG